MGWRAGIPPSGETGGSGKAARDVTAGPMAGASLAYPIFLSPRSKCAKEIYHSQSIIDVIFSAIMLCIHANMKGGFYAR